MSNILVLGGAGYIGSHTVYELINSGEDVVVVDNLKTGYEEAVHKEAKFYKEDISNREFMDWIFQNEDISGVIHFAASSLVGESMTNPLKYYRDNLYSTMILLESMVSNNIDRIVFSSTAAVYGEPKNSPITENDDLKPENAYGETKLAMENMMKWVSSAYGLKYVALRYFNACGAHKSGEIGEAHNPESHLIPLILQVANNQREKIFIYGDKYPTNDGTCIRDYIHVTDLAQAHISALKYLEAGGDSNTFNLGNGIGFSVAEIIEYVRKITGHEIPSIVAEKRKGDPAALVASNKKAKEMLDWEPKYKQIDKIIETAWNWHKKHPYGYGK